MAKKAKAVQKSITPDLVVRPPRNLFLPGLIFLLVLGLIYFSVRLLLVASVNGQLIDRLAIIKELEKQGGKTTLETIISKTLINQEAKKRKIDVSQKDIDVEIKKIETNVTAQGGTLDQALLQQGMTRNDLTNEIKLQLLVTKMVDSNISVTDKEADDYIASQKTQSPPLGSSQPTPELTRDQAKVVIKQQKLQTKIQTFVADLRAKAKINYFIKY